MSRRLQLYVRLSLPYLLISFLAGSDLAPPPLPPASQTIGLALLAGGVAGVVSRTATAPLEKIKIMAQVGYMTTHSGGDLCTNAQMRNADCIS